MSQLPLEQGIVRLKANEERFDTFVNTSGSYTTNEPLPRTVETLPSFIARKNTEINNSIGFNVPVAYAAGIVVTSASKTVVYNGLPYHANPASVPFTTVATFDPTKWIGYSNITREEITARGEVFLSDFIAIGASANTILATLAATGRNINVNVDCVLSANITLSTTEQTLKGNAAITMNPGAQITLAGKNTQVQNVEFKSAANTYDILMTGENTLVYQAIFSGSVGHHVLASGAKLPRIVFCKSSGYGTTIPFVFASCERFYAFGNILDDYSGFGIQARFCKGGKMAGNEAKATFRTQTLTANNNQTVYTFTLSENCSRYGLLKNDNNGKIAPRFTVDATNAPIYKVTLTSNADVVGAGTMTFYGTQALETYQINSGCSDVEIVDNISDGTGDSNIVVCADYHYDGSAWVLNPALVVSSDLPKRSKVNGNTAMNALFANIAVNNGVDNVEIKNNKVGYAGMCNDPAEYHDNCIASNAPGSIMNNECYSDGFTRAGIATFSASMPSNKPGDYYQTIGGNSFSGKFARSKYYFATTTQPAPRRMGVFVQGDYVDIFDDIETLLQSVFTAGVPATTGGWAFFQSGGGGSRDLSDKLGGASSMLIGSGAFLDCVCTFGTLFNKSLVKVTFMAKGNGALQIYYGFNASTNSPIVVTLNDSANWKPYEVIFPVEALSGLSVRYVGGTGSRFQHTKIKYLTLDM